MSRILLKEGGVFGNTDSGGVWLSVRFVRCWVKSHNATVKFETLSKFLMISRRKVRMTSSHHAPYALGESAAVSLLGNFKSLNNPVD